VSRIETYATELLAEAVILDPSVAALDGGESVIDGLTDYSPSGHAARADAARRGRDTLLTLEPESATDALLREHLLERMTVRLDFHEAGEDIRELNPAVTGPFQVLAKSVQIAAPADWDQTLLRLRALPAALSGVRQSLAQAAERGHVASQRQVAECLRRCPLWAADMAALADQYGAGPLATAFASAVAATGTAYDELTGFLRDLGAVAPEQEAFGEHRYRIWMRRFLGAELDLADLYAWGWDEFLAIEAALQAEVDRLYPGTSVADALARLDGPAGPGLIEGRSAFRGWLQDQLDAAMEALDGKHFRVPPALRPIEAVVTQDSGIFYLPPSRDLTRPARVTWSLPAGDGPFGTWHAYTTIFHEGVPGHHLQLGTMVYRGDRLAQRLEMLAGLSAAQEGWALYAESLMDELGFLSAPGARLGYLTAQALRAARVVLDIGLHLGLRAPDSGAVWTPELALRLLQDRAFVGASAPYEVVRYLGRPGQALAYKAGERVYREVRAAAATRPHFDLTTFHERVLSVNGLGLSHLRVELGRITDSE
jgi:uncharacterized protein (DUF885 family)